MNVHICSFKVVDVFCVVPLGLQVLELTKEWTNKWNETQNILKVRLCSDFIVSNRIRFSASVHTKVDILENKPLSQLSLSSRNQYFNHMIFQSADLMMFVT